MVDQMVVVAEKVTKKKGLSRSTRILCRGAKDEPQISPIKKDNRAVGVPQNLRARICGSDEEEKKGGQGQKK